MCLDLNIALGLGSLGSRPAVALRASYLSTLSFLARISLSLHFCAATFQNILLKANFSESRYLVKPDSRVGAGSKGT